MWTEIRLPAIAEDNDPIGRKPGEALCPERFNIKELLKIRDQIGPQLFDAMYQQNPSTPGTQIFKKDWWKFYRKENQPDFGVITQSWDCGFYKTENSSYSVCATIGATEEEYYILDIFRARLEFPELIRAVKNNYEKYHPNLILIESEAAGISLIQTLYNETQLPIKAIKLKNKTKTERAWEITHLIESGKVYLEEDSVWLPIFLEEINTFPHSRYSDQVDSVTQGLYFLKNSSKSWVGNRPTVTKRRSSGREPLYGNNYGRSKSGLSFRPKIRVFSDWLR
jgi:predicted phage terminase large subunit-like protein